MDKYIKSIKFVWRLIEGMAEEQDKDPDDAKDLWSMHCRLQGIKEVAIHDPEISPADFDQLQIIIDMNHDEFRGEYGYDK